MESWNIMASQRLNSWALISYDNQVQAIFAAPVTVILETGNLLSPKAGSSSDLEAVVDNTPK